MTSIGYVSAIVGAVSDNDQSKQDRLKSVLTKLLQHQLGNSLTSVGESLESWRSGRIGVFEAHAEVLKHAIRAERMAGRIAHSSHEPSGPILRDAFDAGIIGRDEFVQLVGSEPDEVEPASSSDDPMGLPIKQSFVSDLLESGPVLVHVDARVQGVSVPDHLARDPKLVLRFGYGLEPAIHDLTVDDEGISGTLTFKGIPHRCILPWPAVYAAVSEAADQRGMVWPEDVPEEVLEHLVPPSAAATTGATSSRTEPENPRPARRRASHLKLVD